MPVFTVEMVAEAAVFASVKVEAATREEARAQAFKMGCEQSALFALWKYEGAVPHSVEVHSISEK